VVVEIEDNGPGIPMDIQQRIFEPFFTTKPPGLGTGLGLHIAYTIINNHYGQIRVDSKAGKTIFRVTLPVQMPR
jgi:two-component system NtrC family sensor kinase